MFYFNLMNQRIISAFVFNEYGYTEVGNTNSVDRTMNIMLQGWRTVLKKEEQNCQNFSKTVGSYRKFLGRFLGVSITFVGLRKSFWVAKPILVLPYGANSRIYHLTALMHLRM